MLLLADKEKSTVVFDREVYKEKVRDILSSHATLQVKKNFHKVLAEIFKN